MEYINIKSEKVRLKLTQEELFLSMVQDKPTNLRFIHNDNQTKKLILSSVSHSGLNLKYANKELIDYEVAETALYTNGNALRYVPKQYRSDSKLLEIAVKSNPGSIKLIKNPSEELIMEAIQRDSTVFKFIDYKKLVNKDIIITALVSDINNVLHIHLDDINFNMIDTLFKLREDLKQPIYPKNSILHYRNTRPILPYVLERIFSVFSTEEITYFKLTYNL
jgi:hypothetical protein